MRKTLVENIIHKNIKRTGRDGETLLHWACKVNSPELVALLCYMGADINAVDINGETPFYISCKNNNLEMMRLLLVCGADPNLADIAGVRPLDWLPVDVKDEIETLYADLSSKDVWRPGIDKLI